MPGLYNLSGGLILGLQVLCAIHAIRNGRQYGWLFLIFFFPLLGSLIYLAVEVYPEWRGRGVRFGRRTSWPLGLRRRIRQLEEEVRFSGTVETRMALAEAYVAEGRHDQALALYGECLAGVFRDDPVLIYGRARVLLARGDHAACLADLDTIDKAGFRDYRNVRSLMRARCLDALGRTDAALVILADLEKGFSGEEARYRYGVLLEKTGQPEAARRLYEQMAADARRADSAYRRREREWLTLAQQHLRGLRRSAP